MDADLEEGEGRKVKEQGGSRKVIESFLTYRRLRSAVQCSAVTVAYPRTGWRGAARSPRHLRGPGRRQARDVLRRPRVYCRPEVQSRQQYRLPPLTDLSLKPLPGGCWASCSGAIRGGGRGDIRGGQGGAARLVGTVIRCALAGGGVSVCTAVDDGDPGELVEGQSEPGRGCLRCRGRRRSSACTAVRRGSRQTVSLSREGPAGSP